MLTIRYQTSFKKDFKRIKKRGYDIKLFETVVEQLANQIPLESKYRDRALSGQWNSFRECHIEPDWLLIYRIDNNELVLTLTRTGTHSELFGC